ncbi:MAG TPA: hypothetical protein VM368_05055 [Flavisolibacter sp.]|nr:hypothetical protein [Flavisolibacter sp.]
MEELQKIRHQLKWLKLYACSSSVILLVIITLSFKNNKHDIIRTKGIIIEDSVGRDRILIGTPIPLSANRVRTDTSKVRKHWSSRLGGEKYMEQYKSYEHSASGIAFLNESGFDKLILDEKTPDPNTGRRIVDAAGFTWNDDEGFERGGLGISKTKDGQYRVVLGIDDPKVGEALHMFILEDGTKGYGLLLKMH